MNLLIAKILVWVLYRLLPSGFSVDVWRWPRKYGKRGRGNAEIYTCPTPKHKSRANSLWYQK